MKDVLKFCMLLAATLCLFVGLPYAAFAQMNVTEYYRGVMVSTLETVPVIRYFPTLNDCRAEVKDIISDEGLYPRERSYETNTYSYLGGKVVCFSPWTDGTGA